MANNYTNFSELLRLPNKAAVDYAMMLFRLEDGMLPPDVQQFFEAENCDSWDFNCEPEDAGVWIYAEESGSPEHVAVFVQHLLRLYAPAWTFGMTFAESCSKPRIGEFGGGAIFVTRDTIESFGTHQWVYEMEKKHA